MSLEIIRQEVTEKGAPYRATSCLRGMTPRKPGQQVARATRHKQAEANFEELDPKD